MEIRKYVSLSEVKKSIAQSIAVGTSRYNTSRLISVIFRRQPKVLDRKPFQRFGQFAKVPSEA